MECGANLNNYYNASYGYGTPITSAASLQGILEDSAIGMLERLQKQTGQRNLCMAGGVALNCSMNGNQIMTPRTLKRTWTAAARRASPGFPVEARSAVPQVPTFAPKARAMPAGSVMNPCAARTMTTPVVAEED